MSGDRETGPYRALSPELAQLHELTVAVNGLEARVASIEGIEERGRGLQLVIVSGLLAMLVSVIVATFWLGAKFGTIDATLDRLRDDVIELRHEVRVR